MVHSLVFNKLLGKPTDAIHCFVDLSLGRGRRLLAHGTMRGRQKRRSPVVLKQPSFNALQNANTNVAFFVFDVLTPPIYGDTYVVDVLLQSCFALHTSLLSGMQRIPPAFFRPNALAFAIILALFCQSSRLNRRYYALLCHGSEWRASLRCLPMQCLLEPRLRRCPQGRGIQFVPRITIRRSEERISERLL